jgi:hypothetical protein
MSNHLDEIIQWFTCDPGLTWRRSYRKISWPNFRAIVACFTFILDLSSSKKQPNPKMLQMTWGVQHSHLLRQVNPEFTHNLGLRSLQMYLQRQLKRADQPRAHLRQEALPWKSPIPDNSRENQRIYQKLITDLYQTTGNLSIYIYIQLQ